MRFYNPWCWGVHDVPHLAHPSPHGFMALCLACLGLLLRPWDASKVPNIDGTSDMMGTNNVEHTSSNMDNIFDNGTNNMLFVTTMYSFHLTCSSSNTWTSTLKIHRGASLFLLRGADKPHTGGGAAVAWFSRK